MGTRLSFKANKFGQGLVTPPVPEIIVFNFPNGPVADPVVFAAFEDARVFLNAGFNSPPMLYNGDQQIHIALRIDNNPPFDGIPGGIVGFGGPNIIRPDGTSYSGNINFELAYAQLASHQGNFVTATHEMLHALGIGTLPNWTQYRFGELTPLAGYNGPQALAEYQILAPGSVAIPVEWNVGSAGSDSSHWDENHTNDLAGANGYNQDCIHNELMTYSQSGSNYFSRITAASLRDIGYNYDVNHGQGLPCGAP